MRCCNSFCRSCALSARKGHLEFTLAPAMWDCCFPSFSAEQPAWKTLWLLTLSVAIKFLVSGQMKPLQNETALGETRQSYVLLFIFNLSPNSIIKQVLTMVLTNWNEQYLSDSMSVHPAPATRKLCYEIPISQPIFVLVSDLPAQIHQTTKTLLLQSHTRTVWSVSVPSATAISFAEKDPSHENEIQEC